MKKLITVLIAITVVGLFVGLEFMAHKNQVLHRTHFVSHELIGPVNKFFEEAESNDIYLSRRGLTVILHTLDGDKIGLSTGEKTVWVDRKFVQYDLSDGTEFSRLMLEYLVFHELGHALLGRDHEDHELSIMNSACQSAAAYAEFPTARKMMIAKLFLPNTKILAHSKTYSCKKPSK